MDTHLLENIWVHALLGIQALQACLLNLKLFHVIPTYNSFVCRGMLTIKILFKQFISEGVYIVIGDLCLACFDQGSCWVLQARHYGLILIEISL